MAILTLLVAVCGTVIIPLGDSITQGISPYNSYRKYLWEMLQDNSKEARFGGSKWGACALGKPWKQEVTPDFDQNHEGHCSIDTSSLLRHVKRTPKEEMVKINSTFGHETVTINDVGIILLHTGSNDIFDVVRKKKKLQSLNRVVDQINLLVDHLLSTFPNSTIFVAQILKTTYPDQTEYLNNRIKTHVNETSRVRQVTFPDFTTERHTFDTTHPNNLGARYIAERWYDVIYPLVPTRVSQGSTPMKSSQKQTVVTPSEQNGRVNVVPDTVAFADINVSFSFVIPLAIYILQLLGCIKKGWVLTMAYGFILSLLYITWGLSNTASSQVKLQQAG